MASVLGVSYDPGNYMDSAMAPAESRYKAKVMAMTWGHLAPEENKEYVGCMVFTWGAYGDRVLISTQWRGLGDSPWLFDDMMEFVQRHAKVAGGIYRFTGTYQKLRSGKARFQGQTKRLKL